MLSPSWPLSGQKNPHAWIALIVSEQWLADSQLYAQLLAAEEKDDVWLESSWESSFWLGIQRAVQSRASLHRERNLQRELETIQASQEHLVQASSDLVKKLESDTQLATDIHRKFYPRFSPDVPGVEVLSKYLPASGKGGDYFDLFEFGDQRKFGILLADSESHRAAASLLSALLKVRLDDLKAKYPDSPSFIQHLKEAVEKEGASPTEDLHLLYGVFDRATLQLEMTFAGSFSPRIWRESAWLAVSPETNPSLLRSTPGSWKGTPIHLQAGDTLLLFSDGMVKAFGSRFESILSTIEKAQNPHDLRNQLLALLHAADQASPLADDVTFILVSVDPNAAALRPVTHLRAVK
jgi:serine phosphatase RsbU (regulator of sigma subunit)